MLHMSPRPPPNQDIPTQPLNKYVEPPNKFTLGKNYKTEDHGHVYLQSHEVKIADVNPADKLGTSSPYRMGQLNEDIQSKSRLTPP